MKINDFIKQHSEIKFPCKETCKHYLDFLGYEQSEDYSEEALEKLIEFLKIDKHTRSSMIYRKTCIDRYGEDYFKTHGQQAKETKIAKYGEDQGKIFIKKAKEAARKNLGENYESELAKKSAKKVKETKIARYGENYASIFAKEAIKIKKEKYGDNFFHEQGKKAYQTALNNNPNLVDDRSSKMKQTCEEKYGPDFLELFVENRKKTCIDRYGKDFGRLFAEKSIPTKLEKYGTIIPSSHCSKGEKEVVDYIKSIYQGDVKTSCYDIISPYELDIYIPDKKVAIEFNGYFYHSEAILMNMYPDIDLHDSLYKDVKYKQLRKTELCEKLGIRLIHILDIDWFSYKQSILKSIIASALDYIETTIYARKCIFKEILDKKQVKDFLNENHFQGYAACSKAFGLYYNDELIQVVTYQLKSNHNNKEIELNRLAAKKFYRIIGGFSKLVDNSMKALNVERITSYIDRSLFDGKGYQKAGFKILSCSEPAYMYIFHNELKRREFGMRKNIEKMYKENKIKFWDSSKSEKENMYINKIPRIYNCGIIKVEKEIKENI